MKKLGLFLILLAGIIFYLCFFKLAPYVCSAIPAGDYKKLADILVYALVGYVGGVGLPIGLTFAGVLSIITGINK